MSEHADETDQAATVVPTVAVSSPTVIVNTTAAGAAADPGGHLLPQGFLSTRGNQIVAADGTPVKVAAGGAYDGEPTYAAAAVRQRDPAPDVVIPPRASAVPSTNEPAQQTARDRPIQLIAEHGRTGWKATGCAPAACPASRRSGHRGPGAQPHDPRR